MEQALVELRFLLNTSDFQRTSDFESLLGKLLSSAGYDVTKQPSNNTLVATLMVTKKKAVLEVATISSTPKPSAKDKLKKALEEKRAKKEALMNKLKAKANARKLERIFNI